MNRDESGQLVHFTLDWNLVPGLSSAEQDPRDYDEYEDDAFLLADSFWEQGDFIWN